MQRVLTLHRHPIWIAGLLAALAGIITTPLPARSASPTTEYVILKGDDLAASDVHLTIIVVDTKGDAELVRTKLASGASFAALAREYSTHPSGVTGGDFGVFSVDDLPPEFRGALTGVKPGSYTQAFAVEKPPVPAGWPEGLPAPGASLKSVERTLGRAYVAATLPADAGSTMTEVSYPFGLRLRIHERRGLGFMEFTGPWKRSIFGIRPDDQIPASVLDLFPRTGRFIRGVFAAVPGRPNWFVDVDDRVDTVMQLLYVDREIYGNLPGVPKNP
jgi:hypothetical protein